MAFLIHTVDGGHVPGYEYLPVSAIKPQVGMAMQVNSNGQLAAATGTTAPKYICMQNRNEEATAGELIPVIRAERGIIFEATFSAAASSVKIGSKVTLSSDGMQVTGTTTDGVAEVVEMGGQAAGDMVRVRFN
jgi:hypothetical protein